MKFLVAATLAASVLSLAGMVPAFAQDFADINSDDILVPDTTVERPWRIGFRTHTNHVVMRRSLKFAANGFNPNGGLGPGGGMTPTQIRSFYGMPSTGGNGTIAIVGAYHFATALNDFNVFSTQFGLPKETSTNATASTNAVFQVVYASGTQPATNAGWAQESALDIEWAHAMAPNAKIVLVEARSNSYSDLFAAIDKARTLPGVKQISMSWGGGEFSSETYYDSHFPQNVGVVYFASSGDTGGVVEYPSCSPNVVAVGGTSVATNSSGILTGETGWSGSGGGTSLYEAKPTYQNNVAHTPTGKRGVPDISADANPNTGVSVYCSTAYQGYKGWLVFGGTSVSSPCMAGMTNVSGSKYGSSAAQLTSIYGKLGTSYLRDVVSGTAGSFTATAGWDFVTGCGAPTGTSSL